MERSHLPLCIASFLLASLLASCPSYAQTKFYALGGISDIYYHNTSHPGEPSIRNFYYGLEVDHYLDYHYAFTSGAFFLQGGYDNGVSRWTNKFIQVPLGFKAASLGDVMGISAGININYLMSSQLREIADTLNNYYSADVTSACKKIQPEFFFGLLFRLNRVTAQMKFAFALTNRYAPGVKQITDDIPKYYGSYYVYVLGKEEQKLTSWTTFFTLSVRLF